MSTVVCQGLQSCFESQVVETKMLRLKLASPKPCLFESVGLARGTCMSDSASKDLRDQCHYEDINHKSVHVGDNHMSSNPELGGWSFLQALSTTSQTPKEPSSYAHPMVNRSSSKLSNKSLELCTENLGSETGTDITESSIFSLSSLDLEGAETPSREQPKSRQHMESRGVNRSSLSFPPPLTTRSSSSSIQVRPHREGGRLIIKAVEVPSTQTYLQAERSHGRLRLRLWKGCSSTTTFDAEMDTEENEDSDVEELENEATDEEEEEEEEDEEEDDEEKSDVHEREDMEGNSIGVGVEMGMEKFQRPSRCKEGGHGNKGLCNWESFWVATS